MDRCCENCFYSFAGDGFGPNIVECRFNAPVRHDNRMFAFPLVQTYQWCGQFKPNAFFVKGSIKPGSITEMES